MWTGWWPPFSHSAPRYNQTVRIFAILLVCLSLFACKRSIETKEAVRQGVLDAVASRVNLSSIDVEVTSINFKGETAEATVDFRPKGGAKGPGIQIKYNLEAKGGKWVVKGRSESGGSSHGATGATPGAMPAEGQMPAGHPPMTPAEPKPDAASKK